MSGGGVAVGALLVPLGGAFLFEGLGWWFAGRVLWFLVWHVGGLG
jgi:hypothetical protein